MSAYFAALSVGVHLDLHERQEQFSDKIASILTAAYFFFRKLMSSVLLNFKFQLKDK